MKYVTRLLFWVSWPALFLYFYHSRRSRVLILQGNKALLVKGWWSLWFGDQRWALPGGGLRRHEQPAQSALRELREELGLQLPMDALTWLGQQSVTERGLRYTACYFVYHAPEDLSFKARRPEIRQAEWLSVPVEEAILKPEVVTALHLSAQQ